MNCGLAEDVTYVLWKSEAREIIRDKGETCNMQVQHPSLILAALSVHLFKAEERFHLVCEAGWAFWQSHSFWGLWGHPGNFHSKHSFQFQWQRTEHSGRFFVRLVAYDILESFPYLSDGAGFIAMFHADLHVVLRRNVGESWHMLAYTELTQ